MYSFFKTYGNGVRQRRPVHCETILSPSKCLCDSLRAGESRVSQGLVLVLVEGMFYGGNENVHPRGRKDDDWISLKFQRKKFLFFIHTQDSTKILL